MPRKQEEFRTTIQDRLRVFRQSLGLDQSELAALIGVSQPEVSKWETRKKYPKTFDSQRDRFIGLVELLEGPQREVARRYGQVIRPSTGEKSGKVPQAFSPVRECLQLIRDCLTLLCDDTDEAKHMWSSLSSSPCNLSKSPWKCSCLAKVGSGVVDRSTLTRAIKADLDIHGEGFVDRWMSLQDARKEQEESLARFWGNLLLTVLCEPRVWENESRELHGILYRHLLTENQHGRLPAGWNLDDPAGTPWLPAMRFLSILMDAVGTDPRKLEYLPKLISVYRESQLRGASFQAERLDQLAETKQEAVSG